MKKFKLKIILFFSLIIISINLQAQNGEYERDLEYSPEIINSLKIYNNTVLKSMECKFNFKSFNDSSIILVNEYDLRKSNSFAKPDSVLYDFDIVPNMKFTIGIGRFLTQANLENIQCPFRNNDILIVFYLGPYHVRKVQNSSPNEYFKFYKFNTKPQIYNIETPLVLIVDKNANISQNLLNQILSIQDTKHITKQIITNILKYTKSLKIVTYKLKKS